MEISKTLKLCKSCGDLKRYSHFYRHDSTRDGYYHSCITCVKKDRNEKYHKNKSERNAIKT
jgi:hypothetical protein